MIFWMKKQVDGIAQHMSWDL